MTLRRNLVANYLGQSWAALMGFAFLPLYIRYLGVEAFGVVGVYALLQAWLALLEMGLSPMLNREMARFSAGVVNLREARTLLRSVETVCIVIAVAVAIGLSSSSDWLAAAWLNVEEIPLAAVSEAIEIMAVVIGLRFCEGIYRSTLLGLQRQVWYNAASSVSATLRWAGAAVVLAFVDPTIHAFFWWQVVVSAGTTAALAYGAHTSLPRANARFSIKALRGIWRFASGMMLISLLSLLLLQVDKLLVSRLLSLSDFALYSLAGTVGGALSFIAGPIAQAYYPRLTQQVASGDTKQLAAAYLQSSQLVAIFTVPPAAVLALFSAEILTIWTADPGLAARGHVLLSLFAVGTLFNCLMAMPYMLQLAHGWTRLTVYVNAAALLVLIPGVYYLAPRFGAVGAAAIWLATLSTYGQVSLNIMHRRLLPGAKKAWYIHAWAIPLLTALLLGLVIRSTMEISTERVVAVLQLLAIGTAMLLAVAMSTPFGRHLVAVLHRRIAPC